MGQVASFCSALASRRCNFSELINDVTFRPPCPCQYIVGDVAGKIVGQVFNKETAINIPESIRIVILPFFQNRSVCLMHIKSKKCRAALIYSHGNAVDCGGMLPRGILLADRLGIDVIIYDYEGYGYSEGVHTENNICQDLTVVFKYTLKYFDSNHIFLYGESIGSVPTCFLASQFRSNESKANRHFCSLLSRNKRRKQLSLTSTFHRQSNSSFSDMNIQQLSRDHCLRCMRPPHLEMDFDDNYSNMSNVSNIESFKDNEASCVDSVNAYGIMTRRVEDGMNFRVTIRTGRSSLMGCSTEIANITPQLTGLDLSRHRHSDDIETTSYHSSDYSDAAHSPQNATSSMSALLHRSDDVDRTCGRSPYLRGKMTTNDNSISRRHCSKYSEDVEDYLSSEVAGVILHSALLSGGSMFCKPNCLHLCDPFDNRRYASSIDCPVFHIHGMKDEIVPFESGSELYELTSSSFDPWWVPDACHNDIITKHEHEYFQRMNAFISDCLSRFE